MKARLAAADLRVRSDSTGAAALLPASRFQSRRTANTARGSTIAFFNPVGAPPRQVAVSMALY